MNKVNKPRVIALFVNNSAKKLADIHHSRGSHKVGVIIKNAYIAHLMADKGVHLRIQKQLREKYNIPHATVTQYFNPEECTLGIRMAIPVMVKDDVIDLHWGAKPVGPELVYRRSHND